MRDKRGFIKLSKSLIDDAKIEVLKTLFSVFYPVAIVPDYTFGADKLITYFGYSEFFKEIGESDPTPEYCFIIKFDNGKITIELG